MKIGSFREDLPVLGDWEFNIQFLQSFEIGVLCECLAYYHHRQPTDAIEYSNSVVDQIHQHENYSAFLRNEWLRQELNSGRAEIGTLANTSWPDLFNWRCGSESDIGKKAFFAASLVE